MTDKINLKEIEKNAHKLITQDGLMEILMGAILFASSSSFSGTAAFVPFLGVYVVFMSSIIEAFRKRFTYPRIGYLKLPDDDIKKVGFGILTFVGVIMIALVVFIYLIVGNLSSDLVYKWIPTVIGLILFGGLYYNYQRLGDKLSIVYIIIAVSTGLIFSILDFTEPKMGPRYYLLLLSGVFLAAGIIRFYSFTKRHPLQQASERGLSHE
jgi:hypothetical protein